MTGPLDGVANGAFRTAFVLFALFAPFSIAGMNFALGIAALAWVIHVIDRHGARVKPDALAMASIALAVSALPSVFMSDHVPRALNEWRSCWELAICFLVGAHIVRLRARTATFWTLSAACAGACLLAFLQRAGGINAGPLHVAAAQRPGGTMFPETFAGVLYQLILFTAAAAASPDMRPHRRWFGAVASLGVVALLLTLTPGAWIALLAGATVLCLLLRRRALVTGAAIALAVTIVFSALASRRNEAAPTATHPAPWEMSLTLFRAHPLFGVGMDRYGAEVRRLPNEPAAAANLDTHNVYLHILATRGLVGFVPLVLYLVILVRSLGRIYRRAGPSSRDRYYAAGAIAATVAVAAGAFTGNNLGDSEVFMVLMFLVGMGRSPLARENPLAAR